MWLYLVAAVTAVSAVIGAANYQFFSQSSKNALRSAKFVFGVLRRDGLRACLLWTQQVITHQLAERMVEVHHKYYIIHYPYGVTWYKLIVPRRRKPFMVDEIRDANGNDVKKDILAFMGPSHNFHGMSWTPKELGYSGLTFTFIDGEVKSFEQDQVIIL